MAAGWELLVHLPRAELTRLSNEQIAQHLGDVPAVEAHA
jgi:vacuolar-type H+-ATPase subunit B/Vma2